MPITAALIGGGASLLGGLLGGSSAKKAAQAQAAAQTEAARIAAEESRFRPVGITTRFGQSQFQTDPQGRVSGASYELDPQLRAMQDRFLGLAGGGLSQAEGAQQQFAPLGQAAQGLFGLGQQYLAQSPQEAAQQYMAGQQNLLAPSRERQFAQLQNQLFQTGRGGLSVGATGERPSGAAGLGAASPEMEAYYNALAQQDAGLAAQAMQAGQQQTAFGAGLFGTGGNLLTQGYGGQAAALGPYQAYLQGATGLEALGQDPLNLGSALGGRNVNTSGANALYGGGMAAAQSMGAANAYNPFATALVGAAGNKDFTNALAKQFNPYGGTQQGAYGQQDQYLAGAFANPQTQQAQMLAAQNFGF
ncbi:MAG: hypothetical protein AN484_21345 [Aphanizomenon flos-aquae WA102]|uniref:Uncharacterized protein n=1 Tax=Aphanizomenon flos-aquae WA102 TaxID=1710896 RepID=A0A1B7WVU3_APHFL|nr:MAG: hypothetical protein AN484_21345 [Aphanizomenon flos-aquae WA102]